jgi:long-chain acyl-CoA synthetase
MHRDQVTRLFDIPYFQNKAYNNPIAFNTKHKGKWKSIDTQTYLNKAYDLSKYLLSIGVGPGDKIAIITTLNCADWNVIDIGIQQVGAISVPIYPTVSAREYEYIFNHAEVKICFLSDNQLFEKANKVLSNCPTLLEIFCFQPLKDCRSYLELLEIGAKLNNGQKVDAIKESVKPDDLATIIYTSGTTGVPKGVMLSHRNIVENIKAALELLPDLKTGNSVLSFLPVCHIMERCAIYVYQLLGVNVYYGEGLEFIGDNIREIKPDFMTVVPRLLEKIYDKIYSKGTDLKGIKKKLFYWSVDLANHYDLNGKHSVIYNIQLNIARKLVFNKWQKALGGNLKYLVCGSAALQPRLLKIFGAAGINIIEGYGLSESPILSGNSYKLNQVKAGTVGKPITGINITIAEDGEILAQGYNVMKGYYKDEYLTRQVLQNGIFHTGDKGEFDADGFLKITGRKKEIFKTSGGKYISPVLLENQLKQSRFIEQVIVIGENEKMPAALIQPDFEFLIAWIKRKQYGISTDPAKLINHKKVIKRINKEVNKSNKKFGQWEQIKSFKLTPDVWGIDNGLLTPTLKVKRDAVISTYKDLYDTIYSN